MTILLFIVILGVLVFVHELGHFLVAKYSGIRVDEFALGFPPRIISKKVGETRYALNLIPFGGYVKIHGEDPAKPVPGKKDSDPRSFGSKNRFIQGLVLVGGIAMNFVFAWILFTGIFISGATVSQGEYPQHTLRNERLMITGIFPDSPAAEAGFKAGDVIAGFGVQPGDSYAPTIEETKEFISSNEGKEIVVNLMRGETPISLGVVPEEGVIEGSVGIGVSLDWVGELKLSLFPALIQGAKRTYELTILTAEAIGGFIFQAVTLNADLSSVSGPVGIATLVGDARSLGWFYVVTFTALISINLGVINLIPFPALDGGRLFFVLIEAIIRRPLPVSFVRSANATGFILLMLLLVVITYRDIVGLL